MKRLALLGIFAVVSASSVWSVDIQSELRVAVEKQKKAASDAQFNGILGVGLTLVGYVVFAVGSSEQVEAMDDYDPLYASEAPTDGTTEMAVGGLMVLAGAVSSFLGWLAQFDANNYQAHVNELMLSEVQDS